jgi:hypothetical protein
MDDTAPNKKKPIMPKDSLEVQAMQGVLLLQHGEIETLKRKLKAERANHRFTKTELVMAQRYSEVFGQGATSHIPDEILARLVRLCHPDRHGGSAAANEATAWLLKQR